MLPGDWCCSLLGVLTLDAALLGLALWRMGSVVAVVVLLAGSMTGLVLLSGLICGVQMQDQE